MLNALVVESGNDIVVPTACKEDEKVPKLVAGKLQKGKKKKKRKQ